MLKLFDNADSDSDVDLKTNNEYANNYNDWRKKEVLYRLKTKYGEQEDDDDDSTSEDDDDVEVDENFEKDFFKTLSCLKNKDPKIYDEKVVFFDELDNNASKQKKNKPMFLKDYERKVLLEKGAKIEDSDEEEVEEDPRSRSPTYVEEQRKLKESLQQALKDDDNDEKNWGGMFSKREKTSEEHAQEEEDYKKWLKGNKEQLDNKDEESALKPLKDYWNKPNLEESEKFLRDYFLNKRYVEKEDANYIPTYEEIIHDSDEGLSEDEEHIDEQEEFELKFNFRYQEPDQEFIKRYPRTVDHSLRKTDDRRKIKRAEIKERKEEDKKQKQEDLKQLKVLKRQEIEEKIKKLKEITGNDEIGFRDVDIDEDFDPEQHDKRMQELFNDDYYGEQEGDLKPEFSDLEEELGPWSKGNEVDCEDENFNMDCDYDPKAAKLKKEKKNKKKRNRSSKQNEKDEELDNLPGDGQDDKYAEYMDELYKLDCEDMIGDLRCRFKYRDVVANDFGLSIEEILLAKDRDLNKWCSLKKTMQYRPEHMEKYDVITYERKRFDDNLKRKLLPSVYNHNLEEEEASHNNFQSTNNEDNNIEDESYEDNINKTNEDLPQNIESEDLAIEKPKNEKRKRKNKNVEDENKLKDDIINKSNEEFSENMNKKVELAETNNKIIKKNKNIQSDNVSIEKPNKGKSKCKNKNTDITNIEVKTSVSENNQTLTRRQKKNQKLIKLKEETKKAEAAEPKKQINKKRKLSEEAVNEQTKDNPKKRKLNKKNLVNSEPAKEQVNKGIPEEAVNELTKNNPKKKRKLSNKNKKVKKDSLEQNVNMSISKARLEAYGINPKKYKNKLKYKKQ